MKLETQKTLGQLVIGDKPIIKPVHFCIDELNKKSITNKNND